MTAVEPTRRAPLPVAVAGRQVEDRVLPDGTRLIVVERVVERPAPRPDLPPFNQLRDAPSIEVSMLAVAGLALAIVVIAFLAMTSAQGASTGVAALWGVVIGAFVGGFATLFAIAHRLWTR